MIDIGNSAGKQKSSNIYLRLYVGFQAEVAYLDSGLM